MVVIKTLAFCAELRCAVQLGLEDWQLCMMLLRFPRVVEYNVAHLQARIDFFTELGLTRLQLQKVRSYPCQMCIPEYVFQPFHQTGLCHGPGSLQSHRNRISILLPLQMPLLAALLLRPACKPTKNSVTAECMLLKVALTCMGL